MAVTTILWFASVLQVNSDTSDAVSLLFDRKLSATLAVDSDTADASLALLKQLIADLTVASSTGDAALTFEQIARVISIAVSEYMQHDINVAA